MSEIQEASQEPEILFWVGCAGSFDPRAQKVTRAFVHILEAAKIKYAILGNEEQCTGDPARRAGNEFVFQMLALQNIQTLDTYNVRKIVTTCPHCFNVLKNEYPALGGDYEVIHHTQLLQQLLQEGRITVSAEAQEKMSVTYHDSCYLGRANDIYEVPRVVLNHLHLDLVEMEQHGRKGLCCGAGGAQMFKEDEPGDMAVNVARTKEAIATDAKVVAVNCPFCLTMMSDGIKATENEEEMLVYDLSELILQNMSQ